MPRWRQPGAVWVAVGGDLPLPGSIYDMQRAKRRRTEVNYRRLNEGVLEIAQTHPHTAYFHEHAGEPGDDAAEPDVAGFFARQGTSPVRIAKRWIPKLEMRVDAARFSPRAITEALGEDRAVPVMDSVTQQSLDGWTLGRWRDYLELPAAQRRELTAHGTLNLISLEFSGTPLADAIERPRRVREHDLVDRVWPAARAAEKPKVQLYSLTSAAQSFTDFHLDFAGTSVFYHVVSGAKSFIFVRPTEANLRAYERWCASSDQQTTWFPSLLPKQAADVFQVDLAPGDSMLIPSGWIHAVHTPEDSSVVGGNFLLAKDMAMQKHIDLLEQRAGVAATYRFPHFEQVCQYWEETQAVKKEEPGDPPPEGQSLGREAEPGTAGSPAHEATRAALNSSDAEAAKPEPTHPPGHQLEHQSGHQSGPQLEHKLEPAHAQPLHTTAATPSSLGSGREDAPPAPHDQRGDLGPSRVKAEPAHEALRAAETRPDDAGSSSHGALAAVELNDALTLVGFSQHDELAPSALAPSALGPDGLGPDESRLASALLTLADNEPRR